MTRSSFIVKVIFCCLFSVDHLCLPCCYSGADKIFVTNIPCDSTTCLKHLEYVTVELPPRILQCVSTVYLISPANTRSLLIDMSTIKECDNADVNQRTRFLSSNFWDEPANGKWTLIIKTAAASSCMYVLTCFVLEHFIFFWLI